MNALSRMVHHALKLEPIFATVALLFFDVRDRGGVPARVTEGAAVVIALATLILSFAHLSHASSCSYCHPKPEHRLKLLHYRAWLNYSRWSTLLAFGGVTLALTVAPHVVPAGKHPGRHFDWSGDAVYITCVLFITLSLSATRFRNVNAPTLRPYAPVRSFFAGPGKPLRHRGHWIFIALLLPAAALEFAPARGVWSIVKLTVDVILLGAVYAQIQHSLALCEQCVTEFRSDAAGHAERHSWRFTAVHRAGIAAQGTGLLVMVFASFTNNPLAGILNISVYAVLAAFTLLGQFHSNYQPWCRYCRNGGEDAEPVHDPTGDHGRPVPVA